MKNKGEIMKLIALRRFNYHDPGEVFEASEENARVWVAEGLAEKSGKAETKGFEEPIKDRAEKKAPVKK